MLAPIVLFVYNRPKHTQLTINALQKNSLAEKSDLIIFSDAAKNGEATKDVKEVRQIISNIKGFSTIRVVEREQNFGLANSIISGVTQVVNQFGRVIVLEDDLVSAPNFLQYMNESLVHYERDPKVFSIGAYQFPVGVMNFPKDYPYDTYSSYRCCSWGWGTWHDRWRRVDWDIKNINNFMADQDRKEVFNKGGCDLSGMLELQTKELIDSWAIRFCCAHSINDMRCIYPIKSLIKNIGLDGSGIHCGEDPKRQHYSLDESFLPKNYCESEPVNSEIAKSFYLAFSNDEANREKLTIKVMMRKIRSLSRLIKSSAVKFYLILFPQFCRVDILFVNTYQKAGGAARSAWRTYLSILPFRLNSKYLTLIKSDGREDVIGAIECSWRGLLARKFATLDAVYLKKYPKHLPVTYTPAAIKNPFAPKIYRFKSNLVHLHWVAGSMMRIEDLEKIKVPIVWTLHDTWAFTGGCHYTSGCKKFYVECGSCPQLGSETHKDLSNSIWLRKKKVYQNINLTVVSPSRWLAEQASKSSLLSSKEIKVIPNGVDTNLFKPIEKIVAKKYLNVTPENPVLLFGAQWITDPRKGADLLGLVLDKINFPCTLLLFGEGGGALSQNKNLNIIWLGTMQDDYSLALIYSAADIFLCPSREDNLPNTILEAMACGTPCVAFNVGGAPDMVVHKINGWLADPFDCSDFFNGIVWILGKNINNGMGIAARMQVLSEFSIDITGESYNQLYSKLITN